MPDPYHDSSKAIQDLVWSIVSARTRQEETGTRIEERDAELHTGGSNFLVRMDRIYAGDVMTRRPVEAVTPGQRRKTRVRGKSRRR